MENEGEILRLFFKGVGIPMGEVAETLDMTRQNLNIHLRKEELSAGFKRLIIEKYGEQKTFHL